MWAKIYNLWVRLITLGVFLNGQLMLPGQDYVLVGGEPQFYFHVRLNLMNPTTAVLLSYFGHHRVCATGYP